MDQPVKKVVVALTFASMAYVEVGNHHAPEPLPRREYAVVPHKINIPQPHTHTENEVPSHNEKTSIADTSNVSSYSYSSFYHNLLNHEKR